MQAAQRRLDELVLGVIAPAPARRDDDYVTIEVCAEEDLSTTQFVRSDYDAIDIAPMSASTPRLPRAKTTTYAPVVRRVENVWFDASATEPADDIAEPPRASWVWLAVSLTTAAMLVIVLSLSV